MIEEELLRLAGRLSHRDHRPGPSLAAELGWSEARLRRRIDGLRNRGVGVEGLAGRGYRLPEPFEALDSPRIHAGLGGEAGSLLTELEVIPSIESTNSALLRRRDLHGMALLAEHQSGGRGRRERRWYSPFARNVYLSVGWRFRRAPDELSFLPLAVAVSAARALDDPADARIRIRWPNDLLLDGRKCGGCLVETRRRGDRVEVVAGIGINVRMTGDPGAGAIERPWTDLASHHPAVSRNEVAAALVDGLLGAMQRFESGGFLEFRQAWERRDALAGREVTLFRSDGRLRGRARGLGARGGLLLETRAGTVECLAGEVTSHAP